MASEFDATVRLLREQIQAAREASARSGLQNDEWLRTLYQAYTERFLSDNGRIWTTGSIMISLSLGAFALLPTIGSPRPIHFIVLGLVSSAILASWLVIAENHRAFQAKSLAWIVAIEQSLGLQDTGPAKIAGAQITQILSSRGAVQLSRWVLTVSVALGWVLTGVFWPR